jgi:predicted phage-related endonuclease
MGRHGRAVVAAVSALLEIPDREAWHALRARHLGASEVAALFGAQAPYQPGVYALWQAKAGRVPLPPVDIPRAAWGLRLEDAIAAGAAEQQGWEVLPGRYASHPSGLGATLDRIIAAPSPADYAAGCVGPGALELKNVDWLQTRRGRAWEGEPPLHVLLQLQAQLVATGFTWGAIAWLVGGNDLRVLRFTARPAVQAEIAKRVAAFWQSIRDDQPPAPDGSDATFAAIMAQREEPDGDEPADLRGDNEAEAAAADYLRGAEMAKEGEALKAAARNVLLEKTSGFRWAKSNAATISVAITPAKPPRPARPDEIIPGRAESVRITVKPYEKEEAA